MDASPKPPLTPYDLLRMARKILSLPPSHWTFIEDYATANWLVELINKELGDKR